MSAAKMEKLFAAYNNMDTNKNLTSNNGTVDEEALRRLFADSVRMHVADNGFSSHVMRRIQEEVPARQRIIYNVWTAACIAACIVLFFTSGIIGTIENGLHHAAGSITAMAATWYRPFSFASLMPDTRLLGSTLLTATLTVVVLGSVALYYDMSEPQQ